VAVANCLKTFIRLVIQILKQYSITQPGVVPKLVATFRSGELHQACGHATNLGTTPGCVIEYCFSMLPTGELNGMIPEQLANYSETLMTKL